MTRMAKRLQMLGIALALMQPVLLAACGSEQAPSTSTGANPTATTAERDAPTSAETDREALVALYNSTDGPNWDDAQNWLSDRPLREWNGVDTEQGRVTYLWLTYQELNGEIPKELGSLTKLRGLHLFENQLSGEIPSELGNLTNLEVLNLRNEDLSGCVPGALQGRLIMHLSDLGDLPFC